VTDRRYHESYKKREKTSDFFELSNKRSALEKNRQDEMLMRRRKEGQSVQE